MNKLLNKDSKIIFLDWGVFLHRSVYAYRCNKDNNPTFIAWRMVLACLNKIGVTPDDIIVVALDSHGKGNWRKEFDPAYKANRKTKREQDDIDWTHWFSEFDKLLENIRCSTPFQPIMVDKLEADDLISYGVRHFTDNECVIVSTDSDYEQLCAFDNVKIFSPATKLYKIVKHPYQVLAKKIKKEVADNLTSPILNKADYNRRHTIVSLLTLPEEIEELASTVINDLDIKLNYDVSKIKFDFIRKIFMDMYNSEVLTYEDCVALADKKKARTKRKKEIIAEKKAKELRKIARAKAKQEKANGKHKRDTCTKKAGKRTTKDTSKKEA